MWSEDFINAKYHLSVAERMFASYREFADKRFLIGVINESARAVSNLIRAFMILEKMRGGWEVFSKVVGPKYLDDLTIRNLFKVLEIEKAQKISPVEFVKSDKIILLIGGKYRILTVGRIGEFINSIRGAVSRFPTDIKR